MLGFPRKLDRSTSAPRRRRRSGLEAETLEPRVLMYSTLGDMWVYPVRITYSLMPDGTNIAGMSSSLFQTMNAIAPTAEWEKAINMAALEWQDYANINLSQVSDNGMAVGASGDQQGDPNVGDIRIGAAPLGSSTLAVTFLPPPANGGTDAGDIILNSQADWGISTNYDVMTVVGHEFGHALGLGESTVSSAVMYGTYNGIKQGLTSDDIAGIQAVWGPRQYDQFNQGGVRNFGYTEPTNINPYINSNAQITLPNLSITYPGDAEWFHVNVPSDTTGTMTVTMQSSGLSLLSPYVLIYNQGLSLVGSTWAEQSFGATISCPITNVTAGAGYYIRAIAAPTLGSDGNYALEVNFGSQTMSPVPPPYTTVPSQPDQGGGTSSLVVGPTGSQPPPPMLMQIGNMSVWAVSMLMNSPNQQTSSIAPRTATTTTPPTSGPSGPLTLTRAPSMSVNPPSTLITTLANLTTTPLTPAKPTSVASSVTSTPPPAASPTHFAALDVVIARHHPTRGKKGKPSPFDVWSSPLD